MPKFFGLEVRRADKASLSWDLYFAVQVGQAARDELASRLCATRISWQYDGRIAHIPSTSLRHLSTAAAKALIAEQLDELESFAGHLRAAHFCGRGDQTSSWKQVRSDANLPQAFFPYRKRLSVRSFPFLYIGGQACCTKSLGCYAAFTRRLTEDETEV